MNHDDSPAKDLAGTELVRRMGHDFNNLFGIVLGGLSLLRDELQETTWTQDCEETYRDLISATREAADVVAKLTAWAGRQALDPENLRLGAVTEEAAQRARQRLGPAVTIELVGDTDTAIAWVDRVHLRDAIGELLDNASDAMNGQGVIRLEVLGGTTPGISVIDAGHGLDPDTLSSCREPYFTTRGDLGRRGLGLSVVDGFARASEGRLDMISEPGPGTRATITLPAHDPKGGHVASS